MKYYIAVTILILVFSVNSITITKETIVQCLKVKSQFPSMNINCEELLSSLQKKESTNNEAQPPQQSPLIEQGAQENTNPAPVAEEAFTSQDNDKKTNNGSLIAEMKQWLKAQIEDVKSSVLSISSRIKKIEDSQLKASTSIDIVKKEFSGLKSVLLSKLNEIAQKKSVPNKVTLRKNTSGYKGYRGKPSQIILKRRNLHTNQAVTPLRRKNKRYIKKIIGPSKQVKTRTKKFLQKRKRTTTPKITKKEPVQSNAQPTQTNQISGFDMELFKELLSRQQAKNNESNKTPVVKKNDEIERKTEEITKQLNIFKINKKKADPNKEQFQHDKHKILSDEASKLFEALKMLKTQQKGILSGLELKKTQETKAPQIKPSLKSKINNILTKSNPPQETLENKKENATANQKPDATLSEIEKQISLLNSLNTNETH